MYATQTDLETRYGTDAITELSDHTLSGAINAAVVERALCDADAIIDSFLAARYKLPLSFTPKLIRIQAEALAYYYLHRNGAPDAVQQDFKNAMQMLKNLGTGVVRLTLPESGADAAANPQGENVILAEGGPSITSDLGGF